MLTWALLALSLAVTIWHLADPRPSLAFLIMTGRHDRRWRLGGAAIVVLAMTIFALATPPWLWKDGEGQGNMFKYLRMAAASSSSGTLDIARAEGPPKVQASQDSSHDFPRSLRDGWAKTSELGERSSAREQRKALRRRSRRNTGQPFDVSKPKRRDLLHQRPRAGAPLGPALLAGSSVESMAGVGPSSRGHSLLEPPRCNVGLGDLPSRPRGGCGVGGGLCCRFVLAVSPPLLLYTYQIYPELPAGTSLAVCISTAFHRAGAERKRVVVWCDGARLLALASPKVLAHRRDHGRFIAWRIFGSAPSRSERIVRWGLLFAPLIVSALSISVYNHALTGSILPDATFRAAGRTSFEPGNVLSGLLGLFLDRRTALHLRPHLCARARRARATGVPLPRDPFLSGGGGLSYVFVIASFPHWPGAVSSVARYILSVTPLAALPLVFVLRRSSSDGILAGVAMVLFAATMSFTVVFQKDIVASHLTKLLLDKALFSDPYQYLPTFLSEGLVGSGPAHFYKLGALVVLLVLLVYTLSPRVEQEVLESERDRDATLFPRRVTLGAAAAVGALVVVAGVLERLPSNATTKTGPVFNDTHAIRRAAQTAKFWTEGRYGFENRGVWVPGGEETQFFVQADHPIERLQLILTNTPSENRVQIKQRGADPLDKLLTSSAREAIVLSLRRPQEFRGPSGNQWVYEITVRSRGSYVPRREGTGEDPRPLGCFVVLSAM